MATVDVKGLNKQVDKKEATITHPHPLLERWRLRLHLCW